MLARPNSSQRTMTEAPRHHAARCSRMLALFAVLAAMLGGCASVVPPSPGMGEPVAWSALPGWMEDHQADAWSSLQQTCTRAAALGPTWKQVCAEAALFTDVDDELARAFFETRFAPRAMGNGEGVEGLVTGYYEPLLAGSRTRTARFRYPIYQRPDDLLVVDLGGLYPELAGRTLRGRLQGRRVVPYFSRAEITNGKRLLAGKELVWVNDPVALFFLQVQGSGRVRLPDGEMLRVGYADQNGHPYQSIGARLIAMGALKREDVNLESIKDWLRAHPDEAEAVLNSNPSYIFFAPRDPTLPGPIGSLNVPLTAGRSAAVDPAFIRLGTPVWLDTTSPLSGEPYRRLLMAQDTGGAIKGPVRVDVFFGFGPQAEQLAGNMKQPGRVFALLPRERN